MYRSYIDLVLIIKYSYLSSANITIFLNFRLPVNKVVITRGPRMNTFYENNDAAQIQTSPSAIIEDTSTSPSQDIDNKLKTLQIQSRT